MNVRIDVIEKQLRAAAAKVVSEAEAAYFADLLLETHLQKAPRMNPLEEAVADLEVWAAREDRELTVDVDKESVLLLDLNQPAPSLKIKYVHDELERRARKNGIAAVGFRNSSGVTTLNPWSERLARRDLIGVAMFDGGTGCTVPFGGTRGVFGTLPLGAAVDRHGLPTTDAAAAHDDGVANLLPIGGGFKGYGLAMLIEILTGSLIRSLLSTSQTPGWNPPEYGGLVIAIDIAGFTDPDRFKREVSDMCAEIRSQPGAQGGSGPAIPGDQAYVKAAAARKSGEIVLKDKVAEDLERLAGSQPSARLPAAAPRTSISTTPVSPSTRTQSCVSMSTQGSWSGSKSTTVGTRKTAAATPTLESMWVTIMPSGPAPATPAAPK